MLTVPRLLLPVRLTLVVLLVAAGVLLMGGPRTASAAPAPCTCSVVVQTPAGTQTSARAPRKPQRPSLKQADVVVTGTVAAMDGTGSAVNFTVDLDRIYKGAVANPAMSFAQDPRCPVRKLSMGEEVIVVAREATAAEELPVALGCHLSGASTARRITALETAFGTGRAAPQPTPPAPRLTKVEASGPERFLRLAAPGAAMLLLGLLGLLGVRRLGRPKR